MQSRSERGRPERPQANDPRLNIYDHSELSFWARQFGVSEASLMKAVDKAGTNLEAVRDELRGMFASPERMSWRANAF